MALRFIEYSEEMDEIVCWLLKSLTSFKFRKRRVFLDKGFCSKPVFKVLKQHKVSFVTPSPVRGKSGGVRTLFQGKSRRTTYTFNSPKHGTYTVQAVVIQHYSKDAMDDTRANGLPMPSLDYLQAFCLPRFLNSIVNASALSRATDK